jgi:hypothetical protein
MLKNYVILEGRIMSDISQPIPATDREATFVEFTLRNIHTYLNEEKGLGTKRYYRIPIIVESPDMISGINTYATKGCSCTVTGRLVRRKRSRPDGSSYMTTCILATNIQIVTNLSDSVPNSENEEDNGEDPDA